MLIDQHAAILPPGAAPAAADRTISGTARCRRRPAGGKSRSSGALVAYKVAIGRPVDLIDVAELKGR
jgi:hypothetical protein